VQAISSIIEIAKRAGVSTGTVSRVINGAPNVSDELRARVTATIAEAQYRPNGLARGLRNRRSKTLGLIIPDITNPFFSELAKSVEVEATRRGFCLILSNSMDSSTVEQSHVDALLERNVDGIIIAPAIDTVSLAGIGSVPIVALDRHLQGESARFIRSDNYGGAASAVRYLLQLGHRNIAFVGGPERLTITKERYRGYVDVLATIETATSLPVPWYGPFNYLTGVEAAQNFLALVDRPTAIFASNDQQAIGVLRAAADAGLEVPGDLSIIGFDDIPLAQCVIPRLTTVAQAIQSLGALSVDLALSKSSGRALEAKVLTLPVSLVVRESTGPPRVMTR